MAVHEDRAEHRDRQYLGVCEGHCGQDYYMVICGGLKYRFLKDKLDQ